MLENRIVSLVFIAGGGGDGDAVEARVGGDGDSSR